jgi:hypothetical protein
MCKNKGCIGIVLKYSAYKIDFEMCSHNFNKHSKYRPELNDKYFQSLINEAISMPDLTYEDLYNKNRICYYRKEWQIDQRIMYVKVVVDINERPIPIITAFRDDCVKESKFSKPIWNPLEKHIK